MTLLDEPPTEVLEVPVEPDHVDFLTETPGMEPELDHRPEQRRRIASRPRLGDRIFASMTWASGAAVLVIMSLVALFLAYRGSKALRKDKLHFFTIAAWNPDSGKFGVAELLLGTVLIALTAVTVAFPLALGTALYISEYAPARFQRWAIALVDLMAAVPSVVYGVWGLFFFSNKVRYLSRWMSDHLGWIPIFKVHHLGAPGSPIISNTTYTASTFIAGIVVGMMITPIMCSVMREVFSQAPVGEREAALGLGATKWGMIRSVVLPFGRGGIIGGTMLGLGRAMGETIAVLLIISQAFSIQWHVLQAGANSVASLIALRFGEASPFALSALMAAGLALFIVTLIVNTIASIIVSRSRSGASS